MNELRELRKTIARLDALYASMHETMDASNAKNLLSTISDLEAIYSSKYKEQLKSFIDYLRLDFPSDNYDVEWNKWVETPYIITHGDNVVVVDNYADVYEGLFALLKEHIKDID